MLKKFKMIKITNKTKEFLWGLSMVVLVSLFTFTVVKIFNDKSDLKYQASLEKLNNNSEARRTLIKQQLDSTQIRIDRNFQAVGQLGSQLTQYNSNLTRFEKNFEKSNNEVKQIKNEKDYIPNNIPTTQQSIYISNYKYEPY